MNRQQRRAAAQKLHGDFYTDYVRHLPQVPLYTPLERGGLFHIVVQHDGWCAFYDGDECNCDPIVTRHVEPRRS
jgi:hypothetical protein